MQPNYKEENDIDIRELFFALLDKKWIIICAGIICAICAGLFSKIVMKPIYTSSTKIYVINRQDEDTTTYSDLQTGTQLTMDYKLLVLSRPVTEQVISDLNLNMTHEQLVSNITVNTPSDTRILEIKVENTDPFIAKQLADAIAEVSAERMVSIMEMEKANIVEPGNIPTAPSSPNTLKNTFIVGFVGVFIASFVILLVFIMDDSIKSIEDIERYLGITTLGSLPLEVSHVHPLRFKIKKRIFGNRGNQEESKHSTTNDFRNANLNFTSNEAYKSLRTNIQFCGKEVKTICITSCSPNEGKTVVSFRLASSLAESGKKVLFIDADLRKSVIIGRLKVDRAVNGLSEYLSGMNNLEEVVNKTKIENVDIIFTGPIPPNPSELLESDMFKELINMEREIYDYIIIDTPPLGVVIDSANVAEVCDGTIMVVESNNISYKFAQRVLKQLEKGKCRVLGAVLNKVEMDHNGFYGKYYGKYYVKEYGYGNNEDEN